ncbi:DUF6571 family protein [uncultured Actinomyces sp.]|uniref:DUF6571 family protein n=1 Tax=uncultured Actinomyces sp. TaxID=249061 RepID=UPI0028E31C12|nr:DUF6571 family protein [uncultured Actinomyces sp.]
MAYVSLDPDALQTLIDGLKGYATTAITNRDDAVNVNAYEDSPTSLTDFSDIVGLHCASLEDEAADLQNRLDAARAANESGLTSTGADGRTISYVIPEGMEDTAENATASNNVDTVNQAREDAASLSDYAKGGCAPDDWDALLARVQAGQDDPAYANALLANIDPGRLLDLPVDIHDRMKIRDPKDQTDSFLRPDAARDLTSALGHVLATASYTWPDDQAADYANKLADATEEKGKSERHKALNGMLMASQDVDVDEDGTAESVGLDYSDSMLTTLAQRMENYSPQKWDNTSPRDWWHRLGDFHDDSHLLPKELYSDNPLAGVVHAMTGNPQAAQNWLVARPDGQGAPDPASADQTKETVQRVQDLVGWGSLEEKGWATDWATMAYEFDSQGWVSSDPAAMSQEERSYQDYASATAVSGILNGIGGGEKPVTLPDGARNLVSETLANHPDSVVESTDSTNPEIPVIDAKTETDDGTMTYDYRPLFTNRALSNLVGQISYNETASSRLGESVTDYNQKVFDDAVATYKDSGDATPVEEAVDAQCRTNGFFAGAAGYQEVGSAEKADKVSKDRNKTASFLAGLIPTVGPEASYIVNVAQPFNEDQESSANSRANDMRIVALKQNHEQLTASLLNSGLYDSDDLLRAVRDSGYSSQVDRVVDEDGNPLTVDMDPSEIGDAGVKGGLDQIGNHLYHRADSRLNFIHSRDSFFDQGYEAAKPSNGEAPGHAWGG